MDALILTRFMKPQLHAPGRAGKVKERTQFTTARVACLITAGALIIIVRRSGCNL